MWGHHRRITTAAQNCMVLCCELGKAIVIKLVISRCYVTDQPLSDFTESPCVRNCCLDDNDICVGCYRSLQEIVGWGSATEEEKRRTLADIEQRKIKKPR